MDALQRPVQRSRVQHVALDDLGAGLHTGPHLLRAAGQAAEPHPLLFQQRDQPTADVAAAARQQEDGVGRVSARLGIDRSAPGA